MIFSHIIFNVVKNEHISEQHLFLHPGNIRKILSNFICDYRSKVHYFSIYPSWKEERIIATHLKKYYICMCPCVGRVYIACFFVLNFKYSFYKYGINGVRSTVPETKNGKYCKNLLKFDI